MNLINRIESNHGIMLGKPVIKGTRITVELILTKLASGFSFEEILKSYDHLTNEDILAAKNLENLQFLNRNLNNKSWK